LRTRFSPMTARPISPISLRVVMLVLLINLEIQVVRNSWKAYLP